MLRAIIPAFASLLLIGCGTAPLSNGGTKGEEVVNGSESFSSYEAEVHENLVEIGFQRHEGDFVSFMVEKIEEYGGEIPETHDDTELRSEWFFHPDENGFQVFLVDVKEEDFIRAIRKAFGEPIEQDGYPQLSFQYDTLGVFIAIDLKENPISLICIRENAIY